MKRSEHFTFALILLVMGLLIAAGLELSSPTGFLVVDQNSQENITIQLEYKAGTPFDPNDDGVENVSGAIDLTVEESMFIWDANESNLCTQWEIVNNETSSNVCYGSENCCSFLTLQSEGFSWDDPLQLTYDKHGASYNNTVYARVAYVDYSLDPNDPYSDIRLSEIGQQIAVFSNESEMQEVQNESANYTLTNFTIVFTNKLFEVYDRYNSSSTVELVKQAEGYEIQSAQPRITLQNPRASKESIFAKVDETTSSEISTQVFAIQDLQVDEAEITLPKTGPVNQIMRCDDSDLNFQTLECNNWQRTDIPFTDNGDTITFTVDSFSGYGGGYGISADISACGTVSTSGFNRLTADISSTGTCITIDEPDVILDCEGHTISYDSSDSSGKGVYLNRVNNVTVRNCIVNDIGGGGGSGFGIHLDRTNYSLIVNNTVKPNGTTTNYGIAAQRSINVTIENNTVTAYTSSDFGIATFTSPAENVTIRGNNVSTFGSNSPGLFASTSSDRVSFIDNVVTTKDGAGIDLSVDYATIIGNTLVVNGTGGERGIDVDGATRAYVEGNYIETYGPGVHDGIFLNSDSQYNTFVDNTVIVYAPSQSSAVSIKDDTTNHNVFINNTLAMNGSEYHVESGEGGVNNTFINAKFNQTLVQKDSSAWTHDNLGAYTYYYNLTIINQYGELTYPYLNLSSTTTNAGFVNISDNKVRVQTLNVPLYNTSATIKLNVQVDLSPPEILVDRTNMGTFQVCTTNCTNVVATLDQVIFDVDSFSSYSVNTTFSSSIDQSVELFKNLTFNGSGFDIIADDIVFDCKGFSIIGNGSGAGIIAQGRDNVTISGCKFDNFSQGVNIDPTTNIIVENSSFAHMEYGVLFNFTNISIIRDNNFTNNSRGIWFLEAYHNLIYNNSFINNTYGVFIENSTNNTFWDNRFNASDVAHASSNTTSNYFNSSVGNHWDDISALNITDTDVDGFGDSGPDYPYNESTGGNVSGLVQDFRPYGGQLLQATDCTTLDTRGATYFLTSNIVATSTCMTIGNHDITVDCQGYYMQGDGGNSDYAITSTDNGNITIRNCNISSFGRGVRLTSTTGIDHVTLKNLTIYTTSNDRGIEINGAGVSNRIQATIENITISGNGASSTYGIFIQDSAQSSTFKNIYVDSQRATSFYIDDSDGVTLSNITLIGSGSTGDDGLYLDSSDDVTISNFTAIQHDTGIDHRSSSRLTMSDFFINVTSSSGYGIQYTFVDNSNLSNGEIYGADVYAIDTSTSPHNQFINILFADNDDGITISARNTTLRDSKFRNNDQIDVNIGAAAGSDIFIFGNNFTTAAKIHSLNAQNWNNSAEGNYWHVYDATNEGCEDTSPNNGFCDAPYTISAGNIDHLPHFTGLESTGGVECTTCATCQAMIDNGTIQPGAIINVTTNMTTTGTCIDTDWLSQITLDCNGNNITGDSGSSDYGIRLRYTTDSSVRNCNINQFGDSILAEGQTGKPGMLSINDSTFTTGNSDDAINLGGESNSVPLNASINRIRVNGIGDYGIRADDYAHGSTIKDVYIDNAEMRGIYFDNSRDITIQNATIVGRNTAFGIEFDTSDRAHLSNITIIGALRGIYIQGGSDDIILEDFFVNSSSVGSSYGLYLGTSTNSDGKIRRGVVTEAGLDGIELTSAFDPANISHVNITGNARYGIELSADNAYLFNNTIQNNTNFDISGSGSDNLLIDNYFNDSTKMSVSGSNSWNQSGRGNRWDTFDETGEGCADTNNDGLCDSGTVAIDGDDVDYFPLAKERTRCSNITESTTFISNVSASGSCFFINQSNIEIQCGGYAILGNGSGSAILVRSAENVSIQGCGIQNFSIGVEVDPSYNVSVEGLTFEDLGTGVLFNLTNISTIRNNTFINNTVGIWVLDSFHNLIYNNTFVSNSWGVNITSGTNNTFYDNNFTTSRRAHANAETAPNYFNSTRGNTWDDIQTLFIFDSNADGIGDTGSEYPYNATNAANVTGLVQDLLPITTKGAFDFAIDSIKANSTTRLNLTNENLTCWVQANGTSATTVHGWWYKDGQQQNVRKLDETHNLGGVVDWYLDAAFDSQGNYYLVSNFRSFGSQEVNLHKYNSTDDLQWKRGYNFSTNNDQVIDIAIDQNDDIYIAGRINYTGSVNTGKLLTMKFNSTGHQLWNQTYEDEVGMTGSDVAVDSQNSVYITGQTGINAQSVRPIKTIKYNSSGQQEWNRTIVPVFSAVQHTSEGIAVDQNDEIFTLYTNNSLTLIARYNRSGYNLQNWSNSNFSSFGKDIEVDSKNRIIIVGYSGVSNVRAAAFNASGTLLDSGNASFSYLIQDVFGGAVNGRDEIGVVGRNFQRDPFTESVFVKWDENFTLLFNQTIEGGDDYQLTAVAFDNQDNALVGGSTDIDGTAADAILIRYQGFIANDVVTSVLTPVNDTTFHNTDTGQVWYCEARAQNDTSSTEYIRSDNITVLCDESGLGHVINESKTFICDLEGSGDGLIINTSNVTVDCSGFTLTGDGTGNAVVIENQTNVTIQNCNFRDFQRGFNVDPSFNIHIENISVEDGAYGVLFNDTNISRVRYATFTNVTTGVWMINAYGNEVFNSSFFNNSIGALVSIGTNNTFHKNMFRESREDHANATIGNDFNSSRSGTNIGNLWDDIEKNKLAIFDSDSDGIADDGIDFPYNFSNDANVSGPIVDYAPIVQAMTSISSCQSLTVDGRYYRLTANISNDVGDCMIISADNVTLDCMYNIIDGDSSGTGDYGVDISGDEGTTVKNCHITHFARQVRGNAAPRTNISNSIFNGADGTDDDYGMRCTNCGNLTISDVVIHEADTYGIMLDNSHKAVLINITTNGTFGSAAIYNWRSNGTQIYGSRFDGGVRGIMNDDADDSDVENTTIHSTTTSGIEGDGFSQNHRIFNVTIERANDGFKTSSSGDDARNWTIDRVLVTNSTDDAFDLLSGVANWTITNSTIELGQGEGLRTRGRVIVSYTTFNRVGDGSTDHAVNLGTNADNTSISYSLFVGNFGDAINTQDPVILFNNTFENNSGDAVDIIISSGSLLANNTFKNTNGYDVRISSFSENVTLYNNIFEDRRRVVDSAKNTRWNLSNETVGGNFWLNFDAASEGCNPDGANRYCIEDYTIGSQTTDFNPHYTGTDSIQIWNCTSCATCQGQINENASFGDTIRLTQSISDHAGNCIDLNATNGLTISCEGNTIDGASTEGDGIRTNHTSSNGAHNTKILDCRITDFERNIYMFFSNDLNLTSVYTSGRNDSTEYCIWGTGSTHDYQHIECHNASVRGMHISASGSMTNFTSIVNRSTTNNIFLQSTSFNLTDGYIQNGTVGILENFGSNVHIKNVTVVTSGSGIIFSFSGGHLIANSSILFTGTGIRNGDFGGVVTIEDTKVLNASHSAVSIGSQGSAWQIRNSELLYSQEPAINTSTPINITASNISYSSADGILLRSQATPSRITEARIQYNLRGVSLVDNVSAVNITRSTITLNTLDINISGTNSTKVNIWNNTLYNGSNVSDRSSVNWNFTFNPTLGNRWLLFDDTEEGCLDGNQDGICDRNVTIDADSVDFFPITSPTTYCSNISDSILLVSNVSGLGGCFVINESNLVVNCAGYHVIGNGSGSGFLGQDIENVTISGCNLINFSIGVNIDPSYNVTVKDSTFDGLDQGILFNETNQSFIINNTFTNNTVGVWILDSFHNRIHNNSFTSNTWGVNITSGTNNTFYDNNFTSSRRAHANSEVNPNYFNTTVGNRWDDIGGLSIFDSDADGLGDLGTQYPYNATNAANVTGLVQDFAPYTVSDALACRDLNETGTYQMTNSISNQVGSCFNITTDNVTLDCQGLAIDGDSSGSSDYGVHATEVNNISIVNCTITGFGEGVRFVSVKYGNITDSIFNGGGSDDDYSIRLINQTHNITIRDVRSEYAASAALEIPGDENYVENFYSGEISSSGNYSISISGDRNYFDNITLTNMLNTAEEAMYMTGANNTVNNSNISYNAGLGIHFTDDTADHNKFHNNIVDYNDDGIWNGHTGSGNAEYFNNIIRNNDNYGIINSGGTSLMIGNLVLENGFVGIRVSRANNTIANNTVKESGQYDINTQLDAINTLIYNNNFTTPLLIQDLAPNTSWNVSNETLGGNNWKLFDSISEGCNPDGANRYCLEDVMPGNGNNVDYHPHYTGVDSAVVWQCDSCASCSESYANASFGDTVNLTQDISSTGTCIEMRTQGGVTFEGNGFQIDGDSSASNNRGFNGNGSGGGGPIYSTIRNVKVSDFGFDIYLQFAYFSNLSDIVTNGSSSSDGYGVYSTNVINSTFSRIRATGSDARGIYLTSNSHNNKYEDIVVEDLDTSSAGATGIEVRFSDGNTFDNVTIRRAAGTSGAGFEVDDSRNLVINNSNISSNLATGIWLREDEAFGFILENSEVKNNTEGILMSDVDQDDMVVRASNIVNNRGPGITLYGDDHLIANNTIFNNSQGITYGTTFADNADIENNSITHNQGAGINVSGTGFTNADITGNVIINNSPLDIDILSGVTSTFIWNNIFLNATNMSDAGANHWNRTVGGVNTGNRWLLFDNVSEGCSNNGQGFCTSPLGIDSDSIDYRPISIEALQFGECGVLNRSVELLTDLNATGDCINVTLSDVVLDCAGHHIVGTAKTGIGIRAIGVNNFTMQNCNLRNFSTGIFANQTQNVTIMSSNISNNQFATFLEGGYFNITGNNIHHNYGSGAAIGLFAPAPVAIIVLSHSIIEQNVIWNNTYGFQIEYEDNETIRNNTLFNNTYAIYINGSHEINISRNNIFDNQYGIQIHNSTTTEVINNTIQNTVNEAIYINGSYGNVVRENTIKQQSYGIFIQQGSQSTIFRNTFNESSRDQARADTAGNDFNFSGQGNFWDDIQTNALTVQDADLDTYGDQGTNWPYNQSNGGNVTGFVTDYRPQPAEQPIQCAAAISSSQTLFADLNTSASCLNITASNVVLDCAGHHIVGTNKNGRGIQVIGVNNVTIRNCNVRNFSTAIFANQTQNVTIIHNNISTNQYATFLDGGYFNITGNNIHHNYGSGAAIGMFNPSPRGGCLAVGEACTMGSQCCTLICGMGGTCENLVVLGGSHSIIEGNVIWNNTYGFQIEFEDNETIRNNTLFNNTYAIYLNGSYEINISRNNMYDNFYGIQIHGTNDSDIINNTITTTTNEAIYLNGSYSNVMRANTVKGQTYGIRIQQGSLNTIFRNIFNDSTNDNARADTQGNNFNFSGAGNFWDDIKETPLDIVDSNSDGFGDAGNQHPYNFTNGANATGHVTDYLPLASNADTTPPSVVDLIPVAGTNFNTTDLIEIAANITDNVQVDDVLINITYPNTTVVQTNLSNPRLNKYNTSFTIPILIGQYNLTFIANDTSGNLNTTQTTFFVSLSNPPTVDTIKLNATSPINRSSDNLTLHLSVSDTEGDSVFNITDWRLNGTSIALVNMPFEQGSHNESSVAIGYSTYGHNGSVTGATFNSTGGHNGFGAYEFDGEDDYIDMGDLNELDEPGYFSISLWFYRKAYNSSETNHDVNNVLIAQASGGNNDNLELGSEGTRIEYYIDTAGGSDEKSFEAGIMNDTWYHLVMTYDQDAQQELKFYLNGSLINSTGEFSGDLDTSAVSEFSVGISRVDSDLWGDFNGTIDDVRVFNRSLSAEQVRLLYQERSDIISNQETTRGDNWSACVTPNDGTNDGTEVCSNGVIIGSALPQVDSISLNATNPNNRTDQNLTLFYEVSDADGESIYNITDWRINGTSIALVNLPFEGGAHNESSEAVDYSTYNHNLSAENVTFLPSGGYDGFGAYEFNKDGGKIQVGLSPLLAEANETISIEAWVKPNALNSSTSDIVQLVSFGTSTAFIRTRTDNATDFAVRFNQTYATSVSPTNLSPGAWTHIVGVHNGTHVVTYHNGAPGTVVESGFINMSTAASLNVGGLTGGTNDYFNGTIDNVRVYARALSAEQVLFLYQNRSDLISSQETAKGENWSACVTPNDRAEDGTESCSNNLTILNTPPIVPAIIEPANNTNTSDTTPFFNWTHSSDVDNDGITYEIQIASDTAFSTIVDEGRNLSDTNFTGNLSDDGTYYWRVKAITNDANSSYNTTWVINVDIAPPAVFDLIPTAGTRYIRGQQITLAANVTDTIAVDDVLANVTYPNASIVTVNLSVGATNYYRSSFTIPQLYGRFNVTIIANDTLGNVNSTETTYWTINIPPQVDSIILNASNATNKTTENLTRYITASDADSDNITNITDWRNNSVSIAVLNMPFEQAFNGTHRADTFVKDYSTYENHGRVFNAIYNSTGGRNGFGAYQFDSSGDRIQIADTDDSFDFELNESFTVMYWSNDFGSANQDAMLEKWQVVAPGNAYTFVFRSDGSGGVLFARFNGTDSITVATPSLPLNTWRHIAGTFDAETGNMSVYIDGRWNVSELNNLTGSTRNADPLCIGARCNGGNSFFGLIDDVLIFDRVISQEQIRAIYENQSRSIQSQEVGKGEVWTSCVTPNDEFEDGNETCSPPLIIVDTPPEGISLDTPANNTLTNNSEVFFNWTQSSDADNDTITYEIEVSNESTFVNIITQNHTLPSNNFSANITDGAYYWRVRAVTTDANSSFTNARLFTIDTTPPAVVDLIPTQSTNFNVTTQIEIAANVTDSIQVDDVTINITYPNASSFIQVLANPANNKFNTSFTLPNLTGQYNVTFSANDTLDNINNTQITFFVGVHPPITVGVAYVNPTPANNTFSQNDYVYINNTIEPNTEINVTYQLANDTEVINTTTRENATSINFTGLKINQKYFYNISAQAEASTAKTLTRTFTTDNVSPIVNISSPADEASITSSPVTFEYNVTDLNPVNYCVLSVNGVETTNDTTITRNITQQFQNSVSNGDYNWSIRCVDGAGNNFTTETRNFTVSGIAAGGGAGGGGGGGGGGGAGVPPNPGGCFAGWQCGNWTPVMCHVNQTQNRTCICDCIHGECHGDNSTERLCPPPIAGPAPPPPVVIQQPQFEGPGNEEAAGLAQRLIAALPRIVKTVVQTTADALGFRPFSIPIVALTVLAFTILAMLANVIIYLVSRMPTSVILAKTEMTLDAVALPLIGLDFFLNTQSQSSFAFNALAVIVIFWRMHSVGALLHSRAYWTINKTLTQSKLEHKAIPRLTSAATKLTDLRLEDAIWSNLKDIPTKVKRWWQKRSLEKKINRIRRSRYR